MRLQRLLDREFDPAFARRASIILRNIDIRNGDTVLDIGCGRGFYLMAVALGWPGVRLYGIDTNKKHVEYAINTLKSAAPRMPVKVTVADGMKLPFASSAINRIICSEVLEHVSKDTVLLSEIYRVLKPGGVAMVSVPVENYPFLWDPLNYVSEYLSGRHMPSHIWWLAGIWADHQRLYRKADLLRKVQKTGFSVANVWHTTRYSIPFAHFLLYGIGKNLVEKGWVDAGFNRFSTDAPQSWIARTVKAIIRTADRFNDDGEKVSDKSRFVNLVLKLEKPEVRSGIFGKKA